MNVIHGKEARAGHRVEQVEEKGDERANIHKSAMDMVSVKIEISDQLVQQIKEENGASPSDYNTASSSSAYQWMNASGNEDGMGGQQAGAALGADPGPGPGLPAPTPAGRAPTAKHHKFVGGPMRYRRLTDLPGIGPIVANRLTEAGFPTVSCFVSSQLDAHSGSTLFCNKHTGLLSAGTVLAAEEERGTVLQVVVLGRKSECRARRLHVQVPEAVERRVLVNIPHPVVHM